MTSFPVAVSLSSTVTLNDGVSMPMFGLGVYLVEPGPETEDTVSCALQNGYRLIDAARIYRNEADVGKAVYKSKLKRKDVFIVSKVHKADVGYDKTIEAVNDSLKQMDTPYIDLYLIHTPTGGHNVDTYRVLVDLKVKGLIRSVGVANYGVQHLEGLEKAGLPRPSVNQIELHPFKQNQETVDYCRKHGITVMGYSPLFRGHAADDPDLIAIAQRRNKSVAQVLIRWSVQRGYITIPKSTKPERIIENTQVFDFALTDDDMKILNAKPEYTEPRVLDRTKTPWEA